MFSFYWRPRAHPQFHTFLPKTKIMYELNCVCLCKMLRRNSRSHLPLIYNTRSVGIESNVHQICVPNACLLLHMHDGFVKDMQRIIEHNVHAFAEKVPTFGLIYNSYIHLYSWDSDQKVFCYFCSCWTHLISLNKHKLIHFCVKKNEKWNPQAKPYWCVQRRSRKWKFHL